MCPTPLPYPTPSSPAATAAMRANRRTDTRPERSLRSHLQAQGLRFRKDHLIEVPGLRVRADVVFTRRRVAVFVDGCFWHGCPDHGSLPKANPGYWGPKLERNVERDRLVNDRLLAGGWVVVRLWEHLPLNEAARLIYTALE
jgi:DNA mismatch endonuclease (patch repair protein)